MLRIRSPDPFGYGLFGSPDPDPDPEKYRIRILILYPQKDPCYSSFLVI